MPVQRTKVELAATILGMTYGDLMEVCGSLAGMIEDKEVRPQLESAQDFASLVHDWADAYEEE